MKVVYLEPRTSFIGSRIHSDTLFGAICWSIRQIYDKETLENILEKFKNGKPPFLLSSTYPYIGNGEKKHFLPKPIQKPLRKEVTSMKDLNKLTELLRFAN
ncbi:MAG: hypothetical protein QMC80_04070 [Thermoplasmatales archaeon]|nr:hypothetical protein [Thermoplasmatales archaeon]